MIIRQIKTKWHENELKQNTYVLDCGEHLIVIDAGVHPDVILDDMRKPIKAVFLTHSHYDHSLYVREYHGYGIPVYTSWSMNEGLQDALLNVSQYFNCPQSFILPNPNILDDGETVDIDGVKVQCIFTPGHSSDSVCYLIEDNLFTGDTLFSIAVGRMDFVNSSVEDMITSLSKLKTLEYQNVYPGHGRISTREEQNTNISNWLSRLQERNIEK